MIRKVVSSVVVNVNRTSCRNICLLYNNSVRTIFTSAGIGIDNFKQSREKHATSYAPSIEEFKKHFIKSIQNPEAKIFTEDLRNMIMSAGTDDEIDAVVQALRKYTSKKQLFSDHFGPHIMRLLYIYNKTDYALQLYMDENLGETFNDSVSTLVLMNKLLEEKRVDDCVKVFEHGIKQGFIIQSGKPYPQDVIMLGIEALYKQAICLADMGRVDEAMNLIEVITPRSDNRSGDLRKLFPLTMHHIRLAAEKSKDAQTMSKLEDLSKYVLSNQWLSQIDFPEYINEPMGRRFLFKQSQTSYQHQQQRPPFVSAYRQQYGNRRDFDGQPQPLNNNRRGVFGQHQQGGFAFNRSFGGGFQPRQEYGNENRDDFELRSQKDNRMNSRSYQRDIRDNYSRGSSQRRYSDREQQFDDNDGERREGKVAMGMNQRANSTSQTSERGSRQPLDFGSRPDQIRRNLALRSSSRRAGQTSTPTSLELGPSTTSSIPTAQKSSVLVNSRKSIVSNEDDQNEVDDGFEPAPVTNQQETRKPQTDRMATAR
ncbi:unnamed protein product [Didymodactylos carnosus]|uniref:Pentatricopeptide repeat-containing protein n=1 Tax=Didymodactylos carnosus TaxID=1234261 RepID=A0A813PCF1_9BILA|nr:unnamed protein product [Didymodactylos carnosus]CAF0859251.1 unnamed protein product [Didymodactylos carnosus]CAF3531070.1 unnamed protein product [Didymodactylos carnosus]CAF3644202.1 unnamed protein product [Didymodactylos carnosus]